MRGMRLFILGLFFCGLFVPDVFGQDRLLEIMREELDTQMKELQKEETPPYHMNFRVVEKWSTTIFTSFGVLMNHVNSHQRSFVPQIRIGSKEFDNFKMRNMGTNMGFFILPKALPLEERGNGDAIRQAIWSETLSRWKYAMNAFQGDKTTKKVKVEDEDKAPSFSDAPVEKYYEPALASSRLVVDSNLWVKRLKEISAVFRKYPKILKGDALLTYSMERRYFINTEGTEVVQNLPYARLIVNGMVKAEDGMELPLALSYFAYHLADLPTNETIIAETEQLAKRLMLLREAPIVDPYSGPVLLSGKAAGVFFHEIFGHRIEGQRMKSESDGQTFKKMLGQMVLSPDLSMYDDPTLDKYNGVSLNGFYRFDDQGVKARRVDVVVDGKLNDFLMTRTPIDGHLSSNGHARAGGANDPVSRQSNLVVETKNPQSDEQLRALLIRELRKQGKECGYYFAEVTSGFTLTGRSAPNAFNVTPLEVYKVYVDGRPDELVRGVALIGTPLSMFSNIIYAGDKADVFTGICGAESGQIPVTAISPAILVSKVEMQRIPKSNTLSPILKQPGFEK